MRHPWLLKLILLLLAGAPICQARQNAPQESVRGTGSQSSVESQDGTNFFYNGGVASNASAVVTFDRAMEVESTGELVAEGDVTILDRGHIWRGTNFIYNLRTGQVRAGWFKTGQPPYYVSGDQMGGTNNKIQTATNAIISTDDYRKPIFTIHAKTITIAPGDYLEAHQATIYIGKTPIFYFPFYRKSLKPNPNNFEFEPGYRGIFGPYLLSAYNWYGSNSLGLGAVDGTLHLDARERRGLAGGPDLALHMGDWGQAAFRYYYAYDEDPGADGIAAPYLGHNRQRGQFYYEDYPTSNLTAKVFANYQSDPLVIRDFFLGEYNRNVEPATFAEVTQLGHNWVLDGMFQPRLVDFFETVERLPEVKLDALRQQVGNTPVYYESESSIGYFERAFSTTNLPVSFTNYGMSSSGVEEELLVGRRGGYPNYSAGRADTFHQLTMPENFFGWLNVTPRIGGRGDYYTDVDGTQARTNQQGRGIFNTGVDVAFKASRVYQDVNSDFWDLNELRHIIQPEVNYAYVPFASTHVPQFDYQQPSLWLLPIDFPEYNDIDSIHEESVVRLTLGNKWQTKRHGVIEDFANWAIYTDWNLAGTNHGFSDMYNDISFRPRSWVTFTSHSRYDTANSRWREAINRVFIQPTTALSLSVGYYYLMNNDPEFQSYPGQSLPGHNLIDLSVYYRLDENWGVHIGERFEAQNGTMQQQLYSIYRDLRSWTAALAFRVNQGIGQPTDFTVALTLSFKAFPRYKLNGDNDHPNQLFESASGPNLLND